MTLDTLDAGPALRDAAAAPWLAPAAARAVAPSRLLLFVGLAPSAEVAATLAAEGMRCLCLAGMAAAVDASRLARFDALVVDAGALGATPAAALARLRAALGCPLIVSAARGHPIDEVLALELGADAWLPPPPLAPRRLRAQLLALLRSHAAPPTVAPDEGLGCPWRIDRVHNRLHGAAARPVVLTEAQAALLQCLLDADGRVVPRARLADTLVPSHGRALQARSIDVYVHRLRARLREASARAYDIDAVRGRGYRLVDAPPA